MILIVAGVAGSGKTTVGALLAGRLRWRFADADTFHSEANVAKMRAGIPLTDEDRQPWLRAVCERRAPVRGAPSNDGDRLLAMLLGDSPPREAYVAPIESGERVVAILYADNLPSKTPIGDTSALEVVLHEAGLALERAVLERALAEAETHDSTVDA